MATACLNHFTYVVIEVLILPRNNLKESSCLGQLPVWQVWAGVCRLLSHTRLLCISAVRKKKVVRRKITLISSLNWSVACFQVKMSWHNWGLAAIKRIKALHTSLPCSLEEQNARILGINGSWRHRVPIFELPIVCIAIYCTLSATPLWWMSDFLRSVGNEEGMRVEILNIAGWRCSVFKIHHWSRLKYFVEEHLLLMHHIGVLWILFGVNTMLPENLHQRIDLVERPPMNIYGKVGLSHAEVIGFWQAKSNPDMVGWYAVGKTSNTKLTMARIE